MRSRKRLKILVFLLSLLVFGLITTFTTDLFTKSTTSPTNITYSADDVLYPLSHQISITQSKKRGFPFISHTKVVNRYIDEGVISTVFNGTSTWVQEPAISSTGSNSFTRILLTWQFYADVLTWMIVWSLLGYSIKSLRHKNSAK
jgi:hypothetical protein